MAFLGHIWRIRAKRLRLSYLLLIRKWKLKKQKPDVLSDGPLQVTENDKIKKRVSLELLVVSGELADVLVIWSSFYKNNDPKALEKINTAVLTLSIALTSAMKGIHKLEKEEP